MIIKLYKKSNPENRAAKNYFEKEENEDIKSAVQAMIDFDREIIDLNELQKVVDNIANETIHSTELIINHPLYAKTNLIDHLIFIISDQKFPMNIRAQAAYALSPFIEYFDDDQVNNLADRSFIRYIYEFFNFYYSQDDDYAALTYVNKILLFLSNLASGSKKTRDEVIWQFPIQVNKSDLFTSFNLKAIDTFQVIYNNIEENENESQKKYFLLFFKCLSYYPLDHDVYQAVYEKAVELLEQLQKEYFEDLLKSVWYICKNGFTNIITEKYAFFSIFDNVSFFDECSLSSLKCTIKILKSMIDYNIDLENFLKFKVICRCITELDSDRSIIILNFIDYLISNDDASEDIEDNALALELEDKYLIKLLNNRLLYYLKRILDHDDDSAFFDTSIENKIASIKVLKTIIFKNDKELLNIIVKNHFVMVIIKAIELQDIYITQYCLKMLLVILNNCTDNGVWSSIIYQIRDSNINGYEILSNIKNDVEELFDENSNNYPTLDEIYLNAEEVLRIIDSISPEDIPDYGDFILASDDDEDKNYIIRASDDEDEMSSRKSFHQFMGLIKPLCGISSDGED